MIRTTEDRHREALFTRNCRNIESYCLGLCNAHARRTKDLATKKPQIRLATQHAFMRGEARG